MLDCDKFIFVLNYTQYLVQKMDLLSIPVYLLFKLNIV